MLPYSNLVILASILFFLVTKILSELYQKFHDMYCKRTTLSSIPERNENEEDLTTKWVPKKKHEVLKAKYKCLKKLFQIYDASVIGILPESCPTEQYINEEIHTKRRKKKRSHRTKADACAGTTEVSLSDITRQSCTSDHDKSSIANAVIRDLKSCTQIDQSLCTENKMVATQESKLDVQVQPVGLDCEGTQTSDVLPVHPVPYLVLNEKRRLTRFQCFIHRILGIRGEKPYKSCVMPNGHLYASSENTLTHNYNNCNYSEKRRRRGLRFRKLRRPKKIQSESSIGRELESPTVMSYMQSVQRNCLMDTTQRQCPIPGCHHTSYGIINYNDHLVLCHFPERKFTCRYCHEGFETEIEKLVHENEHIGMTKITTPISRHSSRRLGRVTPPEVESSKCNVPDDKLKKIVSFFDTINDPNQILTEIKKNRSSDSNLSRSKISVSDTNGYVSDSSDKQTMSCMNFGKKLDKYPVESSTTRKRSQSGVSCHLCGEDFNYRSELSMHMEMDHGDNKFSKLRNNGSIINGRVNNHVDMVSEDGKINVQSVDRTRSAITRPHSSSTRTSYTEISRRKSEERLSYDPSSNIVYYSSVESMEKQPASTHFGHKGRTCNTYKWEPGTKIIHV